MNVRKQCLDSKNRGIRPQRAPWVELVERGDNTLTLTSDRYRNSMVLNEVAAVIWELCDGETAFEQILEDFKKIYKYEDDAENDILTMMHALQSQGLLYLGNENDCRRSAI